MDPQRLSDYQSSYDRIAEEYANRISGELDHKPLDRMLLDEFAARVKGAGRVCDLGCGPGHVARYLHDRGVDIFGMDLSPGMLEQARKRNPAMEFRHGNMLTLDVRDRAWAAIVAFYSIVHIPKTDILQAFREMFRVLEPGGLLFLAFHIGIEVLHEENCWGHQVSLDLVFFGWLALLSRTRSSASPMRRKSSTKAGEPTSARASQFEDNALPKPPEAMALHNPGSHM